MNLVFLLACLLSFHPSAELTFECCQNVELDVERKKTFNPFDICNKACLLTQVKGKHFKQVHKIGLSGRRWDTETQRIPLVVN